MSDQVIWVRSTEDKTVYQAVLLQENKPGIEILAARKFEDREAEIVIPRFTSASLVKDALDAISHTIKLDNA